MHHVTHTLSRPVRTAAAKSADPAAPAAAALRARKPAAAAAAAADAAAPAPAPGSLALTSAQLTRRPDLVAVDGVLYDLKGFAAVHPGGGHIQGAGAYDASALYHSMHAGKPPASSKLLAQFRVGVHLRDATASPAAPVYRYDSPFAKDLLRSVRKALKEEAGTTSWYAPWGFWLRVLLIAAATVVCEYRWLTSGALLWAVAVGACHAQIGLSIQHDASHGAVSRHAWVNSLLSYGADWVGNSKWIWFQQHILWHHPHTNHAELDPDASSAEPLVLFHPDSADRDAAGTARRRWYHAFQHWFLHAVLSLYGPTVVYNPTAVVAMQHNEHVPKSVGETPYMFQQKLLAWTMRLFYLARVVVLPVWFGGASLLAALAVPSGVAGICLTGVFVVSHNFEGSDRNPSSGAGGAAAADRQPVCWYKAQAETSCTYGGTVGMLLTGGLNLQIEHHLFPRLSSWRYPAIRPAVQECCRRHGVKYTYFPNLWTNAASMFRYIKKTGRFPEAH